MKFLIRPFLIGSCLLLSGGMLSAYTYEQRSNPLMLTRNITAQELLGTWEVRDPETDEAVTLIFSETEQLFLIIPTDDGTLAAIQMGYEVNAASNPNDLNLILNEEQTALTIFELTPEKELLIQLDSITPGEPRPRSLSETATRFIKISDETALAEEIEIVKLDSPSSQPDVAVQYITILSRIQQAYYWEYGKFASNLEELGIAAALETELYHYELMPPRDTQFVAITAQPKQGGLSSYVGAVFKITQAGEEALISGICQTDSPSQTPPALPSSPSLENPQIQCPAGTNLIHSEIRLASD